MVYQDLSQEVGEEVRVLAPVQDRFLAFAFDAALCFPMLFILLKPLWKKIQFLSLTAIESTELKVLLLICAVIAITLFVVFNAFCLYRWGATPGKKIFQIRVVSIDGNPKIGFSQACLRSFVWTWQIVCLGIPFLETLSHKDRRPWHDRLSETIVLTNKRIPSESPHWIEQHFFRNLYWAFFSVVALTAGLEIRSLVANSFHGEMRREELVKEGYLCSQLSEALPEGTLHRLDFGLGLFLVGQINSECLENELDFVLWTQDDEQAPWAYLTRGFLSEAGGNDATEEFNRACPNEDPESVVCSITQWKLRGEVSETVKDTWLYKVAHLKELIKQGDFENLKVHINSVQWPLVLQSYAQSKGLQGLFVRGKTQAFAESFPILSAAWDHDQRMEVGAWGCLAQLTQSCETKVENSACENLRAEMRQTPGKGWPRPVTLALAKESVCRGRNDKEVATHFARTFLKTPETEWVQDLVEMNSFEDRSWNRVREALKTIPADDWLYAQGLHFLAKGALTPDRQNYLQKIFAEPGSEDLFWWLAKSEYQKRESQKSEVGPAKLNLRVPTSQSESEK